MTRIYENARWDNIGLDIQGNFNAKVSKKGIDRCKDVA